MATMQPPSFKPFYLFLYGPLMNPAAYQMHAKTARQPVYEDGVLLNYRLRMWSSFPAVTAHPGGEVRGKLCVVRSREEWERIINYEGDQYYPEEVMVLRTKTGRPLRAKVMLWGGKEWELKDGTFDLAQFDHFWGVL